MSIRPELVPSVSVKDNETLSVSIRPELVVETFTREGRTMTITPPLRMPIEVTTEDGEPWFNVSNDEFCIHTGATTLTELSEDVAEWLFFKWDNYAHEDDARLTRGAQLLKATLLARVNVTP